MGVYGLGGVGWVGGRGGGVKVSLVGWLGVGWGGCRANGWRGGMGMEGGAEGV
jgi:hypothetical protein